ncbi:MULTISPECIES: hypothetical protein [Agrobacterium]|uniref:Uncharacterized protein n=1 Tax=Agrobacterium tumefaciens TaxID=358 RepID=A0AAF0GXY9_AGRTU|nr:MULTISPECIES: hypothetical protein [Agrobacterium]WGM58352.1 hypothetical protein CFBP5506_08345 [Agrobacterium tumefaciens]CVI61393.1 hypothetical protein AGR9A_Cc70250 [Agrobacterium salinitolerans str. Hayward 0363]
MITREELYELVWSKSVSAAAKQFDVSYTLMARVCRRMDVPRPPLGYPSLVKVGRAPPRPPLPAWRFGTPQVWAKRNAAKQPRPPRVHPPSSPAPHAPKAREGVHPLATEAAKQLETAAARVGSRYLSPRKKLMADIATTKECMGKCLRFANALFNRLESDGHAVVVAPRFETLIRVPIGNKEHHGAAALGDKLPWSPLRPTVACIFGVPIGLAVIETSEKVPMIYVGSGRFIPKKEYRAADHVGPTWERINDEPTGRLKLVAYSPFHNIPWRTQWIEGPGAPLDRRLDDMVGDLVHAAIDLAEKLEATGQFFD